MDTHNWQPGHISCKLKTARQKKRLQKEDKDRQLIHLYNRYKKLWDQKRNLPMVPLKEPYQKGWKRIFVLREDVRASVNAPMYQQLLDKINTVQYSTDKSFKTKARRRKNRKLVYEDRLQALKSFNTREWTLSTQTLTDEEKRLFHPEAVVNGRSGTIEWMYVYSEPWRFTLHILPHIISEVQAKDCVLEQEIAELRLHLDRNHLWPKIVRYTNGRSRPWRTYRGEKHQYEDLVKKETLHVMMEEYCDYKKNNENEQS